MRRLAVALAFAPVCCEVPAFNGYLEAGYGNASKGMGGTGFALAQDAIAPATNPAAISLLSDRLDVGLEWLIPRRSADIEGNRSVASAISGRLADGHYGGNGRKNFFAPEIGISRRLDDTFSFGLAVYANGANTDYPRNPYGAFQLTGEPGHAGFDLAQAFLAPTLAMRASDRIAFGAAPIIAIQRFKIDGLQAVALEGYPSAGAPVVGPLSESPRKVTNNGYDYSTGVGYRIGVLYQPWPAVSLGLAGQPTIHMQRFSRYAGLLAGQGIFDIPASYGGGIAFHWDSRLVFAFDVQRILYGDVESLGNGIEPLSQQGRKFGADGGPGFGWRDMTIYKVGLAIRPSPWLVLRSGFSYGRQPIPRDQTFINIFAPEVNDRHVTAGASIDLGAGRVLSAFYLLSPTKTVRGHGSIPDQGLLPPEGFGGGEATLHLKEEALGISLSLAY